MSDTTKGVLAAAVDVGSRNKILTGIIAAAVMGGGICAGFELELRGPGGVEIHVHQPGGEDCDEDHC